MKKHCCLIMAHNEYTMLEKLVYTLDCKQIDFFIHIDAKAPAVPDIITRYSRIEFISRIPVYWGHVSQVKAELALLKHALDAGDYSHMYLVSGTHLPLLKPEKLYSLAAQIKSTTFQQLDTFQQEATEKIGHFNPGMKYYTHKLWQLARLAQIARRVAGELQHKLEISRKLETPVKATNWGIFTRADAQYLTSNGLGIQRRYKMTMCGDEYFAPTELTRAGRPVGLVPKLLYQKMTHSNASHLSVNEAVAAEHAGFWFARKFDAKVADIVIHELNLAG